MGKNWSGCFLHNGNGNGKKMTKSLTDGPWCKTLLTQGTERPWCKTVTDGVRRKTMVQNRCWCGAPNNLLDVKIWSKCCGNVAWAEWRSQTLACWICMMHKNAISDGCSTMALQVGGMGLDGTGISGGGVRWGIEHLTVLKQCYGC